MRFFYPFSVQASPEQSVSKYHISLVISFLDETINQSVIPIFQFQFVFWNAPISIIYI